MVLSHHIVLKINMATTGHEKETVNIEGLKASLQKFKDEYTFDGTDVAYLGADDGQGVIPGFDPENDCVWNKPQVMSTAQKDNSASNIFDKDSTNGMARVILKATDDFKDVVESYTGGNVVFVIRYDYTLSGNTTIPSNCILLFEGGSLDGDNLYIIDLNNCQIIAPNDCIFKNVTLQGTTNDIFNLVWIVDGDNVTTAFNNKPDSINRMVFRSTKVYYISDTVTFNDIYYLDWDVTIYYNGTKSNISVVRLNRGIGALVYFRGWFAPIDNTTAVDQINDNTNVVGLEIICINDSDFYIGNIGYFNENVRVSALGAGCCENKFHFDRLYCANRHLRIYQNDADGHIGWANENYFYGGHFFNYSSWTNQGKKSTAIHIEGGPNDNYNGVNALVFRDFNLEGYHASTDNGYTIYAKNIQHSVFNRIRNEGGSYLIKLVGGCSDLSIDSSFGPASADISECTVASPLNTTFVTDILVDVRKELKSTRHNSYKTSEIVASASGAFTYWQTGSEVSAISFNYSDVAGSVLGIRHNGNSTYIAFVKNGTIIDPFNGSWKSPFIFFRATNGFSTASGHKQDAFLIPTGLDVDIINIGCINLGAILNVFCSAVVNPRVNLLPEIGLQADAPTEATYGNYSLALGREYYCTDTKKKIMWNGSAWVDATGTVV